MRSKTVLLCLALVTGLTLSAYAGADSPRDGGAMVTVAPAAPSSPTPPTITAAPASDAPLQVAATVYEAVVHGNWWLAMAAGLLGLIAAARRWLLPKKWLDIDEVGTAITFAGAFLGAMVTALGAGHAVMSGELAAAAFAVGISAAGGYSVLWKRFLLPLVDRARG